MGVAIRRRINCGAVDGRRGGLAGWSGWQIHRRTHGRAEKVGTDFCLYFILLGVEITYTN
jgi:hypothetical protein